MNFCDKLAYGKLVKDNIPNIIKKNGENPVIRILSKENHKQELEKKLLEVMLESL